MWPRGWLASRSCWRSCGRCTRGCGNGRPRCDGSPTLAAADARAARRRLRFLLVSGTANIAQWYRFRFFFTVTHYWVAWITIGALLVHVAAKLAIVRANVGPRRSDRAHLTDRVTTPEPAGDGLSRRGLGIAVGTAAGGHHVDQRRPVRAWAGRSRPTGPPPARHRPAGAAGQQDRGRSRGTHGCPRPELPAGGGRSAPVRPHPGRAAGIRTAHVEAADHLCRGVGGDCTWHGPRLRDLLDAAGIPAGATVRVESLEARGGYRASEVNPPHARDPLTLLATGLNGVDLDIDHGYPARLIAPNRPGVLQTKWVHRVVMT